MQKKTQNKEKEGKKHNMKQEKGRQNKKKEGEKAKGRKSVRSVNEKR